MTKLQLCDIRVINQKKGESMNKNLKPETRLVIFLYEEERQAVEIAKAKARPKLNLNGFGRAALKSECAKYDVDFETGEVKK